MSWIDALRTSLWWRDCWAKTVNFAPFCIKFLTSYLSSTSRIMLEQFQCLGIFWSLLFTAMRLDCDFWHFSSCPPFPWFRPQPHWHILHLGQHWTMSPIWLFNSGLILHSSKSPNVQSFENTFLHYNLQNFWSLTFSQLRLSKRTGIQSIFWAFFKFGALNFGGSGVDEDIFSLIRRFALRFCDIDRCPERLIFANFCEKCLDFDGKIQNLKENKKLVTEMINLTN